jgi:sugar phosphate permease
VSDRPPGPSAAGERESASPYAPPRAALGVDDGSGRAVAYAVTWVSYATYYLGRKGLSVAKASMESTLGAQAIQGIDTAYLASYALGQYVNGWLGDRVGARRLIGFGMLLSAAACFAFGASRTGLLFSAAMFVNGLAQSTGWPGNVKAMAEWTPASQRGSVMGVWSTCYQVGGVAANGIAGWFLAVYGWPAAFHGPAVILAAVGVGVLVLLRPGPLAPAAPAPGASTDAASEAAKAAAAAEIAAARRRLLTSVTIWSYGGSYFCLKLIRYSLLLWLPYYLEKVLHYEKLRAANVSTSFEIGGIAGTILIGLLSDRLRHIPRSVLAAISLVGLAGAFQLYIVVGSTGQVANFLAMALVGFLLFGPDSLLSGAAAQDAGGPAAAALAAGLINGIGSLGAILQETVTRTVSARWGWDGLFRVFVALSLAAVLCLAPTFRRREERAA